MIARRAGPPVLAIVALASLAACRVEKPPAERRPPAPCESIPVRTSDLVAGEPAARERFRNPYEGNVEAIGEGKRLYIWMNCAGCHGAIGGGSIGPPLSDESWIYGGDPENVYRSIVEGRPNGMPSYRGRLPDEALWKVVAFVRSLGGAPVDEEPGAVAGSPEEARGEQPQKDDKKELKEGGSGSR
jgi:cytochrome c oxidase cbb3-type subunit III